MATPRLVNRGSHSENSTGGSFTFRVQTAAGSNHALLVRLYNRGNVASPTVTYNGDSVTLLERDGSGTDNSARWAAMFLLVAPDDGDNTVSVSWGSGSASIWHCVVEHWCDVDQSTPTGTPTSINGGSATRTGSSITVSAAVGDMVIDALAGADTMTVGAGQTRGPSYPTPGAHGSFEEASSASVTMDWTSASGTYRIGHVGVALKGAASASAPTFADRSGSKGNKSLTLGTRIGAEPVSAGATVYFAPCASTESASIPDFEPTHWPYAGQMRVGIRVTANATTSDSTLTLLEDGSDAATGGFTIPAGTTGYFASAATYSTDGTPLVSFKLVNGGGGTLSYDAVWLEFEPDDPTMTVSLLSAFSAGSEAQGGGITKYLPAQGSRNSGTTISQNTTWLPFDADLRYLHLTMAADTRAFDSTIDLLKNEATTALSLTILGSEVEVAPDAGPEPVLIGDRIQHRVVTGAGTGILDGERFNVHAESAENHFLMSCARGAGGLTLANNADRFIAPAGELEQSTTESAVQFEVPFDFTAIRMWVDVQANGQTGSSGDDAVFVLRVNGADTALKVRIARGDLPDAYIDFVTAVDLEAGDLINFRARTTAPLGSVIINSIGIVGVSAGAASPTLDIDAAAVALSGSLGVSGDIEIGTSFDIDAAAVALSGSLAVSGDIQITEAPELDLDPATLALSGALSISGDIQIGTSHDLAANPVALSGALAVSGDIEVSVDPVLDIDAATVALSGSLAVSGDIDIGTSFDVEASAVELTGAVLVSGDIQASEGPVFVMPEAANLVREPAELRWVREPAETRFIAR